MSSDLQTYQNQVAELYIVFFGRAPDAEGMNHWVQALSNGATIHDLAVTCLVLFGQRGNDWGM